MFACTTGEMGSRNLTKKTKIKKIWAHCQAGCNGSGNGHQNCARNCSHKRVEQVMWFMESGTTWYTCSATLHRTGHARNGSNRNTIEDSDSPRKQVQSSTKIYSEVSRLWVRILQCCRPQSWLPSPKCLGWIQRWKSAYHCVTFLHKRVFRPKALVQDWHEKQALEHLAHGRDLWLDAMTHERERNSIVNIYQER